MFENLEFYIFISVVNLGLILTLLRMQKRLITEQNDFSNEVKKSFQESQQEFNAELKRVNEVSVQQIESLFSIFFTLEPKLLLPQTNRRV